MKIKTSRIARSVILIFGLTLWRVTLAYDLETASTNMAQDLMTCMTYYNYWGKSNPKNGGDLTSMEYNANWSLQTAKLYVPEIKKLEAMSDLSAMQINKIVKEEGSTRLVVTYAELCKSMLENPTDRMKYWLDKK